MQTLLIDLFLLRDTPYRHACEDPAAPRRVILFIALAGIVYGCFVALSQRALGVELHGIAMERIPDWVLFTGNIISGLVIAVVAHAGFSIVVWLMAKAVGGPGLFAIVYRVTAYVMPLGLLALPRLGFATALPEGQMQPAPLAYDILAVIGVVLTLIGLYKAMRVCQGTSPLRTAIAVALAAVFCASILTIA
jgi:hypothetical protein